jgi:hypothetical protein
VEKWLKERRGRTLGFADIKQVHQIVAAITRTIALAKVLDETIAAAGGWPLSGAALFPVKKLNDSSKMTGEKAEDACIEEDKKDDVPQKT